MVKAELYNQEGKKVDTVKLNSAVFEVPMNEQLIYESAVAAMANRRKPYAHAKGRSEVRGGGRKPWRQKGTGRARHGSIRSPLWIGGGVTFGPSKERNFAKKINKKAKKKALFTALSQRVKEGGIILLESLTLEEAKTKKLKSILKALPTGAGQKLLIVLDKPNRKVMQAVRNLDWVRIIGANNLNILEVLSYPKILILKPALEVIEKLYSLKK
jgi:large subunit ribosomal protein L4